MLKALEHARLYASITLQQLNIILHARNSLLFSKEKHWEKTMVMRSESFLICIYYFFLGKYMESKTQVSTRTTIYPVCTRLVDQLRTKYGKVTSGPAERTST